MEKQKKREREYSRKLIPMLAQNTLHWTAIPRMNSPTGKAVMNKISLSKLDTPIITDLITSRLADNKYYSQ